MEKSKIMQIGAIVALVIIIAAIIIFAVNNSNTIEPESSSGSVSSSAATTAASSSAKQTTKKTTEKTTAKTTEKKTEKATEKTTKKSSSSSKNVDILVNANNPLPDDWSVDLVELRNGYQIDRRAYESLQQMMDDARAKGWNPLICSAYRSTSYQQQLFDNRVQRMKNQGMSESKAIKDTEKWIAIPGTSEHETGLAVDIVTVENQNLDNSQLKSACQQWLMEHCYDYGFILRYPEDKTKITGIGFEPWHYRYVGYDAAQKMKAKGICLEEYKK